MHELDEGAGDLRWRLLDCGFQLARIISGAGTQASRMRVPSTMCFFSYPPWATMATVKDDECGEDDGVAGMFGLSGRTTCNPSDKQPPASIRTAVLP